MQSSLPSLYDLLVDHDIWILFLLAMLETSFVTGLLVPAGIATSIATVLALEEGTSLSMVAIAAVAGGALGDSIGFWIGRAGRDRLQQGRGMGGRVLRRHQRTLGRFLGRHPAYSVTVARLVSMVRTLMPMAAGMTELRYGRFVAYEAVGVGAWAAMYMGIGFLAQESLERVTWLVGLGWGVVFLVAGMVLWGRKRRRTRGKRPFDGVAPEGPC